jgi:hypothetical protein
METKTDNEGNRYIEQERPGGDTTVIAYLPNRSWAKKDVVSMRIRDVSGAIKYGVEVPVEDVPELVAAIIQLLSERTQTGN